MSVVAWIAFGMIAGYTVGAFVPVDEALGTRGHVALGSIAAVGAGLIASAMFGVNPLSPRVDMLTVVFALIGAVAAIVAWNNRRGPLAKRRSF